MSRPTITLTGVTHRYGPKLALDVDRLVIGPGSTALLGPNGSGKTTLARLMATVTAAQTGTVRIDGLDPSDPVDRIAIRRRLGYQTQTGALPPRMRVGAFCDYVGALKEIPGERRRRRWTHWALDRVGLADSLGQRIRGLSGGMQRRLALAQALIGLPDLLILDEPLASLDADQRSSVVGLVRERAAVSTVVVATHHADELAGVCDHVVIVHRGGILFAGPPARLAARATGFVWETTRPVANTSCRAVGPGRYRCVGPRVPDGAESPEPSVQDGYFVEVARADGDRSWGR